MSDNKMTNEELVLEIRSGKEADKNILELYSQNEKYIKKIASKYKAYADIDDLMQESYFGLIRAVEQWTPDGGASFSSYAYIVIENVIRRYISDNSSIIRIPEDKRLQLQKYNKAYLFFKDTYLRDPTDKELSLMLGITLDELNELYNIQKLIHSISIDAKINNTDDDDITIIDTIENPTNDIEDMLDNINHNEFIARIKDVIDEMSPEYSNVLKKRYMDGLTRRETGYRLNLSYSSVRKIEKRALNILKKPDNLSKILPYIDDCAYSMAYHTGLKRFKATGMSSPERIAIYIDEKLDNKNKNPSE
jgi:RNA polymerase primary sigma factor